MCIKPATNFLARCDSNMSLISCFGEHVLWISIWKEKPN